MPTSPANQINGAKNQKAKALTPEQVQRINGFLLAMSDYGEIRLIVQRGELRYINTVESYKVCGEEANR